VLLIAAAAAALIRLVLLPERPRAELERLHHAIHAGVARVLGRIAAAVAAGAWTAVTRRQLRQDVDRLDETVMLAQARAATIADEPTEDANPWLHLLTIELAIERTARAALQDLGEPADRKRLLDALTAMQRRIPAAGLPTEGQLGSALALLDHVLHEVPVRGPAPVAAPPAAAAPQGLRAALQTATATALAIAAGDLVSPNRWYWAAFAAFVMFQGTRSRGEALVKGTQFVLGTLGGVLFGMLAATALSGHEILSMAAIVAAVFLAFQANVVAYGRMVFWITVILGMLFGMLGFFPPDLLLLRLKETAVGCACGALVACLVLAVRGRSAVDNATRVFLRALGSAVDGAARALLTEVSPPDLAICILASEQRFRDLSTIAQSEHIGLTVTRDERQRRRMLVLEGCELWAREVGQIALQGSRLTDPALARTVREAVTRIDAVLARLIQPGSDQPAAPVTPEVPVELQHDTLPRVARLLIRIEAALIHMVAARANT